MEFDARGKIGESAGRGSTWQPYLVRLVSFGAACALTLFAVVVLLKVDAFEREDLRGRFRAQVSTELDSIRSRLEASLTGSLLRTQGVAAQIIARGDITPEEFQRVSQVLIAGHPAIRDIVVSRGTVISMVFPLIGNEGALGKDYRDLPGQWPSVQLAINERRPVLNGPVDLVQGGRGLIVRDPVFIPSDDGTAERFFGIVSIALNIPGILKDADIARTDLPVRLAIRSQDAAVDGAMIYGERSVFDDDAVAMDVVSPYGTWRIAAEPRAGWAMLEPWFSSGRVLSVFLFLFVGATSFGTALHVVEREQARQDLRRSERRLAKEATRLQAFLKHASDGIHILDARGRVIEASDHFCHMLGYSYADVVGMNVTQWDVGHPLPRLIEIFEELFLRRQILTIETRHRRRDGELIDVELSAVALDLDGEQVLFVSARDITERNRIGAALRIAAVAFESHEGKIVTDRRGIIMRVNRSFSQLTGYEADEVIGQTTDILRSDRHDADFFTQIGQALKSDGFWQGEIWGRRKSGECFPAGLTVTAVCDSGGVVTHYVGGFLDITQRLEDLAEIHALAFYDPLTQLPNRRLLMDRLRQMLAASARSNRQCALLFVDLDNFKMHNDTLGHEKGDLLLRDVAHRLSACVRESDTVARLGGDEFIVVLESLSPSPEEAAAMAEDVGEKIIAAIERPFELLGRECRCSCSVGVTLFGGGGGNVDEILTQADIAMFQAKLAGRNSLRFFSPELQAAVQMRSAMEEDLRRGIEAGQFQLFFQPQLEFGRLVGAEALIRWQHPSRGLVGPNEFIPLAEETGLILPLGNWVWESACELVAAWAGHAETAALTLAVNVSARQFRRPNFVDQIVAALDRTGADPKRLKLELTESVLADNVEDIIGKMVALRVRGLQFSLDDFGTGYSSLSYLKRLPLDQLKIDQTFVRDVLSDANDSAIVQSVIGLGRTMGLSVIAEGVETEEQRAFLELLGCHAFQGYLFSRPVLLAEFLDWANDIRTGASRMVKGDG